MSVLVEQQDETINTIETQAAAVEKDTEAGYDSSSWFGYIPLTGILVLVTLRKLLYPHALLARSGGSVSSLF